MTKTALIFELLILTFVLFLGDRLRWHRYGSAQKGFAYVLVGCATLVALSISELAPTPTRTVTLTALNERNENSAESSIYLEKIKVDGETITLPELTEGKWTAKKTTYCWFAPDDDRRDVDQTDSISFEVKAAAKTELVFFENRWKGKVLVQTEGYEQVIDTYWNEQEGESQSVSIKLPFAGVIPAAETVALTLLWFAASLVVLCVVATLLLELARKTAEKLAVRLSQRKLFRKLASYQFLFEELVKRDFKKKYKRTVLGMAWSVLSPLLSLLVMRLMFTQFFGRSTPHYTTYLFCGNLVFSYFNESTSQGMTSLMGNAGIFSKVNVPKYLFLFSKNVQTLINFGLTLSVFFVFCVLDNITFTWKFVCLLYPICCLVIFNIGVGLILSALFVFFRDIQYLWSVFTQLLNYMSAIFYTIDNYSQTARNMFLLNPVYLFIRYFRKIVIEATIPSIYFHLLMLADAMIVLAIGCFMYKKYNTKFLYYV